MFGTRDLALFVATGLVLNATPGVDMLFTLSRTLQHGWRAGIAASLGIVSGCVVHRLVAAYLLWLAWDMLRAAAFRGADEAIASAHPMLRAEPLGRIYWQGFLTNVLNPKIALFFLALLPQFIATNAPNKPLAFLFLAAVFIVNGTVFLFALVALAQRVRRFGANRTARRVLNAIGGVLFAALAVRLVQAER